MFTILSAINNDDKDQFSLSNSVRHYARGGLTSKLKKFILCPSTRLFKCVNMKHMSFGITNNYCFKNAVRYIFYLQF